MMTKVTTMMAKAKDAMKDSGTSGLRKFVRKDLKEIKDRVDIVHGRIVRNYEMKLISEDVAKEQMTGLYIHSENLMDAWDTQIDNTIEFYDELKNNMFAGKDFSKLTDDEYKCLKLIVKERTKLQRLSAELQGMRLYVDTMLEDYGFLDDMDDLDIDDEEISEELKTMFSVGDLAIMIAGTKRYDIEYIDDPKLTLYIEDGGVITITVTPDRVVHVSDTCNTYSVKDLETTYNYIKNPEAKDGIDNLLKLVDAKEIKGEMANEETK